jgi:hypothetical protein
MFEIKYRFAGNYPEDVKNADEMTLRYELFLGSLWLEKDNKMISMDWEWIPLLDFALCLHTIYEELNKQVKGEEIFYFTESDAIVTFRRAKDKCEIFTSLSDISLMMSYAEFQDAVQQFCKTVITDILSHNKGLKDNNAFKEAVENAGLRIE